MFDMLTHDGHCKSSQPTAVTPAIPFGFNKPDEFPPEYKRLVTARDLAIAAFILEGTGGRRPCLMH